MEEIFCSYMQFVHVSIGQPYMYNHLITQQFTQIYWSKWPYNIFIKMYKENNQIYIYMYT